MSKHRAISSVFLNNDKKQLLDKLSDMSVRSDYHVHSAYSGDGIYSVAELFDQFEDAGLESVAIADHDCIDAVYEAVPEAEKRGIECIPAVEVSTFYQNMFIHILGYGFHYDEETPLSQLLDRISRRRIDNIKPTLEKLRAEGLYIDEQQVWDSLGWDYATDPRDETCAPLDQKDNTGAPPEQTGDIGAPPEQTGDIGAPPERSRGFGASLEQNRGSGAPSGQRCKKKPPMVSTYSRILLADHRNDDHPLLRDYRPDGPKWLNCTMKFAVDHMIYGKRFYVPELQVSMEEGVDAITASGGVAVMAHPGVWMTEQHAPVLEELREHGLLGMEVFTPYHTAEQVSFYRDLATKYDLYMTHGSDYHGAAAKPRNKLGIFVLAD